MGIINQDWYARNEGIAYPLDESATLTDDSGAYLPSDIVADLKITYPSAYGFYPFLASVSVTPNLVTLTIEAATSLSRPAVFRPLAVVCVTTPVPLRQHIPVLPQAAGVAGWVVFGQGAADRTFRARFSSPRQALLAARSFRAYRALPVQGLRDVQAGTLLSGVVRLSGQKPLEIVKATMDVDGMTRDVIVFRLVEESADAFAVPVEAQKLLPATSRSVFERLAGPCAGRPESYNCGDPQPVEFVNSVPPDCDGQITLDFRGCAVATQLADGHGAVIDCALGVNDACVPPRLPDDQGDLPTT